MTGTGRPLDAKALQDTIDHVAIQRLQAAYADVVNRRAWGELGALFLPDATVTIDRRRSEPLVLRGPDAVGRFIGTQIEPMDFFEFVILNVTMTLRVDGDDDRAVARMYMCELRHEPVRGRSTAYGVYHDRYRRVDGRWQVAGRTYHSMARTGAELDVFGFPDGPAASIEHW